MSAEQLDWILLAARRLKYDVDGLDRTHLIAAADRLGLGRNMETEKLRRRVKMRLLGLTGNSDHLRQVPADEWIDE